MSEERSKRSVFMEGSNILRYRKKWEEEEKAEEERKLKNAREQYSGQGKEIKRKQEEKRTLPWVKVQKDSIGNPTGHLGVLFDFAYENISIGEFEKAKSIFLRNIKQQINNGKRTYTTPSGNSVTVHLNIYDTTAQPVTVIFGTIYTRLKNGLETDSSYTDYDKGIIFIAIGDITKEANTATHEFLHIAGLMDRYFELIGYVAPVKLLNGVSQHLEINSKHRLDTLPMKILPQGYDGEYLDDHNMMSAAKDQITQQQWKVIFNSEDESANGGLGVVSIMVLSRYKDKSKDEMIPIKDLKLYKDAFSKLAFTATKGYKLYSNILRSFKDILLSKEESCYILHSTKNIYPEYGEIRTYYELPQADNKELFYNQKALDGFTK